MGDNIKSVCVYIYIYMKVQNLYLRISQINK